MFGSRLIFIHQNVKQYSLMNYDRQILVMLGHAVDLVRNMLVCVISTVFPTGSYDHSLFGMMTLLLFYFLERKLHGILTQYIYHMTRGY